MKSGFSNNNLHVNQIQDVYVFSHSHYCIAHMHIKYITIDLMTYHNALQSTIVQLGVKNTVSFSKVSLCVFSMIHVVVTSEFGNVGCRQIIITNWAQESSPF